MERLFERFELRYDTHSRNRRTDDDVWRPVRQKLEERNLAQRPQERSIRGGLDDIVSKHAWKNGQWHVYEPLSFDLADADGIKSKAREWLGHLSAVVAGGRKCRSLIPNTSAASTQLNHSRPYRLIVSKYLAIRTSGRIPIPPVLNRPKRTAQETGQIVCYKIRTFDVLPTELPFPIDNRAAIVEFPTHSFTFGEFRPLDPIAAGF